MLAILTTHPIQYQVPLWQALAKDGRVPFEVWYLTSHATKPTRDREFGKEFAWDLDMLAGYPHRFLDVARGASPNSFWKCRLKEKLRDRIRNAGVRALWINGWQVAAYWQAVREAKAAGVEVWLRGESNDLAQEARRRSEVRDQRSQNNKPTSDLRPLTSGAAKQVAKRILLGQLFRRVDRFLYIGSANKRLYQKFGVPNEKLFRAPYAVDNQRFAMQANQLRAQRTELKEEWKIPDEAFCVLFCGKFIPKKRPMDLIAAAERLLSRERGARSTEQAENSPSSRLQAPGSSLHLLFAGSGELGDELRAHCNVVFDSELQAFRSNLLPSSQLQAPSFRKPAASFAGFLNQTEISKAYVVADVLVLPSDYSETWGLVVNEAMASGLPCIISDRCGCAEDLGKVELNTIFECGNIESLADELIKFRQAGNGEVPADALRDYSFKETVDTVADIWSR